MFIKLLYICAVYTMYFFKFIHSNQLFGTLPKSFYVARSIKLLVRYPSAEYFSGGEKFMRTPVRLPLPSAGRRASRIVQKPRRKLKISISILRNLFSTSQCQKPTHSTQHCPNTLPKTNPTLIHSGEDPSRLSVAIAYLNKRGSSTPWL